MSAVRRPFRTHREREVRGREPRRRAPKRAHSTPAPIDVHWQVPAHAALTDARVRSIAAAAARLGRRPGLRLSIVFVSDRTLARMHARWLGDGRRTDVITFDLSDDLEGPCGELYVSAERARKLARERKKRIRDELALYIVHGVLHLCGYDDHAAAERARMRAAEVRVLETLGYQHDPDPTF